MTLLNLAVHTGNKKLVTYLVEKGANINTPSADVSKSTTQLHICIRNPTTIRILYWHNRATLL